MEFFEFVETHSVQSDTGQSPRLNITTCIGRTFDSSKIKDSVILL